MSGWRRMTDDERETVRLLLEAYSWPTATQADIDAANAHAENAEQDLPWGDDPERASHLQDVALRASFIHRAREGQAAAARGELIPLEDNEGFAVFDELGRRGWYDPRWRIKVWRRDAAEGAHG